jgi:hypothetical protein
MTTDIGSTGRCNELPVAIGPLAEARYRRDCDGRRRSLQRRAVGLAGETVSGIDGM